MDAVIYMYVWKENYKFRRRDINEIIKQKNVIIKGVDNAGGKKS